MKNPTVICLVIAACLVLVGGAVFRLVMATHHWDFNLLNSNKMETKTVDITEVFQNISIHSDTEVIEFRLSDDGKCRVVCFEKEKEPHTVTVSGETLTIEQIDSRKWYDYLSPFSFGSPKSPFIPCKPNMPPFLLKSTPEIFPSRKNLLSTALT